MDINETITKIHPRAQRALLGLVAMDRNIAICIPDHGGEYLPAESTTEKFITACSQHILFNNVKWVPVGEIYAFLSKDNSFSHPGMLIRPEAVDEAVELYGAAIDLKFLGLIKDLPNCRIGVPKGSNREVFVAFSFDGGFGGLITHQSQRIRTAGYCD